MSRKKVYFVVRNQEREVLASVPLTIPEGYQLFPTEIFLSIFPENPLKAHREELEKRFGIEVAINESCAYRRVQEGEEIVPALHHKYVNRVVVSKAALNQDFDRIYEKLKQILPKHEIHTEYEDAIVYRRVR